MRWRGRGASRRAFLGGAAAALTLPWLESLSRAGPPAAPLRFLAVFVPNGLMMERFRPAVAHGPLTSLPPLLQPLAGLQDELLVISGLANRPAIDKGQGDHARGTGGFLTCRTCLDHPDDSPENGVSFDQVLAGAIGHLTPFPSLELGASPGIPFGICDSGFTCAYTANISWNDAYTPRPKIVDPAIAFQRLFAGSDAQRTAEEAARRQALRTSVLDHVLEEAHALESTLSASDQIKLDAYTTASSSPNARNTATDASSRAKAARKVALASVSAPRAR